MVKRKRRSAANQPSLFDFIKPVNKASKGDVRRVDRVEEVVDSKDSNRTSRHIIEEILGIASSRKTSVATVSEKSQQDVNIVGKHADALSTRDSTTITLTSKSIVKSSDNEVKNNAKKGDYGFEAVKLVDISRIPKYGNLDLVKTLVEADNGVSGYLLDVYYDGSKGVATVRLYDDENNVMYVWFDATGHKPYFLTDLPPDKIQGVRDVVSHPGFDHLETVEKFDLLRWTKRRVTKIVVKTPDIVRVLRDKVPRAWEANIKYHHNYIYDLQLIPGMKYRVAGKKLEPIEFEVGEEEKRKIAEAFKDENESTIRMAIEWLPIFEQPPPKMKMLAVDIEVFTPFKGRVPSASEASYPVISVGFASNDGLRLVFILARQGLVWGEKAPKDYKSEAIVEIFDSERALILETIRLIANYPLILTFNGDNFDFPYLYNRALKLGIPKQLLPFRFTRTHVSLRYGLHIDLYKFFSIRAIQSYAFGNAYKEFTLDAIAQALLGEKKVEIETTVSDLTAIELVTYNLRDAELTLKLVTFNGELVWKLIVLLMRISKLPLEDVTRSQVSAWIKSLFYWEHRRRGYLIPTREEIVQMKGRVKSAAIIKGKKYQGAIVLDPPSGVFFRVVVLDFASLYPSIIKKWNLSYETINPAYCPESKLAEIPGLGHKVCVAYPGLTAQIVGLLRDYRVKIYKKKAKDKSLSDIERQWYDVVQSAMKVYINASYGVFGAENFPLYAPPLAESVTAIGRYAITETLKRAAELGLKVLYGDTDSLFIWNPDKESLEELRRYVDERFGLELEIDKEYKFVTFSGLKKNYIGVYPDGSVDIKGLLVKKRNTPEFLKKEFKEIIAILSNVNTVEEFVKAREVIRERLKKIYYKLKDFEYNLDELAIKMAVTKRLEEYTKHIPQHVRAALQLKRVGIEVLPGDVITFVKVRGKDSVKPIQLARLLEVDVEKYIEHVKSSFEQVLTAISISWDEIIGASKLEAFFGKR